MQTKNAFGIKCPECRSHRVVRNFDETVCNGCGLVLEDTVFVSGRMG
ncbi:MAG: TFIIB-type zinc ribbon-containing protein [Candidatus Aenigmatarchaeota archaeon]